MENHVVNSEIKITVPEKQYIVPDGEKCYSVSKEDGGWEKINCQYMSRKTDHISAREAQASGLGYSGGSIDHYFCSIFRVGLSMEIGYGVKKCDACLRSK